MGKKIIRSNWRIEVYPRNPGDFGAAYMSGQTQTDDEWRKQCEAIARQIERHVDDLPSSRGQRTQVICDTTEVCEFCGYIWAPGGDGKNACCDTDSPA